MSVTREDLTVAVIGCGHWGPNHIRVFSSLPEVRVTWAVDLDEGRQRHVASLHQGVQVTDDPRRVIADTAVDAVVIATPATTHHALALAALRAGKHVLCEKPLCLTSAQCEELIKAAADSGVVLLVGHVFLFNLGVVMLRELIAQQALGRPYYAAAVRTNLGPIRQDANAAFDLAAHEVSIFNFLFNSPPLEASATGRAYLKRGVEDVVFITLTYPDEVLVGITVSWLGAKKVREISLVGEKRMVTWNDLAPAPLAVYDKGRPEEPYYDSFGEFQLLTREGDVVIPKLPPEEPLLRQARCFVDVIRRKARNPCDGRRGWEVVRTIEAINESMRRRGAPVTIDRYSARIARPKRAR